jgi:hypothetical protein
MRPAQKSQAPASKKAKANGDSDAVPAVAAAPPSERRNAGGVASFLVLSGSTPKHPLETGLNVKSDPGPREDINGVKIQKRNRISIDYADMIVDGIKRFETRNPDRKTPLNPLKKYVGHRIHIIRTGADGPAKAIGAATVGEPELVVGRTQFWARVADHCVLHHSDFDIEQGEDGDWETGKKYLYPMLEPIRYDIELDVAKSGMVGRAVCRCALQRDVSCSFSK